MWQTSQEPSKSNKYRHATEYSISFFLTHTHGLQQDGQVIIFKAYVQTECKKLRTDRRTRWAHVETGSSDKSMRTDKQEVMAVTSNFRGHSDAIGLCHEALKHTHTHVHTHTEAQQYSGLNINHRGWQVICRGAPSFSLSFSFLSFLLSPLLLSLCSFPLSLSLSLSLSVWTVGGIAKWKIGSSPPSLHASSSHFPLHPSILPSLDLSPVTTTSITPNHNPLSTVLPPPSPYPPRLSPPRPFNPSIHLFRLFLHPSLSPPGITVQDVSP